MSEDLGKRMKDIVIEEDRAGYVIDAVANDGVEETDESVKKTEKKTRFVEGAVAGAVALKKKSEKSEKKVLKVKDKNMDERDSVEEDAEKERRKEKEVKRAPKMDRRPPPDGGQSSSAPDEAAPSSNEAHQELRDSGRRTLASFHISHPYKRLSLVADALDLKNKLEEAESKLVVIYFFATWCGPCKMISPRVDELAKEYPDVVFLKVDVDDCDILATEYNVQSMPTFVFIKNSAKIETFSGGNYEKLKETIVRLE